MSEGSSSQSAFQFIDLSDPTQAATARRRVRSHAARHTLARQRQVVAYQKARKQGHHHPSEEDGPSNTSQVVTSTADAIDSWPGPFMRLDEETFLRAMRPAPSLSDVFARPLSPFERHLVDHFLKCATLGGPCCERIPPAESSRIRQDLVARWAQASALDVGMLACVFLTACRSLTSRGHAATYEALALRYKGECIRLLKIVIASESEGASNATVTKILALAADAVYCNDLAAAEQHIAAVDMMAELRERQNVPIDEMSRVIWLVHGEGTRTTSSMAPECIVKHVDRMKSGEERLNTA